MNTKVCTKCGNEYPATREYFYADSRGKYGLQAWCRKCHCAHRNAYRADHPELVKEQWRKYSEENRERERQRSQKYRADNKESYREYKRKHSRKWRAANPERTRETGRRNYLERSKNPSYRISANMGSAMSHSLRGDGKGGRHWETLVGYTLADLIAHLESQFTRGMAWGNYGRGGWHIDHIRPISDFNFTTPEDPNFKECWSLWNLQPLWESKNISKHNNCEAPPLPLLSQQEVEGC